MTKKRICVITLAAALLFAVACASLRLLPAQSVSAQSATEFSCRTLDDGTLEITGCTNESETLVIPDQIEGKTVTGIDDWAFAFYDGEAIQIPDTVTSIGAFAFYCCENLVYCSVSASVTTIGNGAFVNCGLLERMEFGAGAVAFGDGVFDGCTNLMLYCRTGSTAAAYAAANGLRSVTTDRLTSVSGLDMSLPAVSFVYSGTAVTPAVTVAGLTEGVDFTVTYYANDDYGTACAVVSGIGDYCGSKLLSFEITKPALTGIAVGGTSWTYDGEYHGITVTAPAGAEITFSEDGDYYTYEPPVYSDAGSYLVYYKVTLDGYEEYDATATMTISPMPLDQAGLKLSAASFVYTGTQIKPAAVVPDAWWYLSLRYSYANNINPGTATVVISTTDANFTGTVTLTFSITAGNITGLTAYSNSTTTVTLTWDKIPCTNYRIYRYDTATKTYKLLKTTTATSFTNINLTQCTYYEYKVKANCAGTFGATAAAATLTVIAPPSRCTITSVKNAATIKWSKNTRATGYILYRCTAYDWMTGTGGEEKKLKTLVGTTVTSFQNTNINLLKSYYYYVVVYKKVGDTVYYSEPVFTACTDSPTALCNGATLKSHTTYKVSNTQGKTTTSYTAKLSANDIKILKAFAKKHFTTDMTRADKVTYTLNWINRNVTYASSSANWNKISGKSYVDAIFNYKLGQCAQYNGALVGMLAYLGYDVTLIQGYRGNISGSHWQHFWGEIKIAGLTLLLETGNYGKNGDWMYCMTPYSEAGGYIKNRKNL
ncbi:MAG: leucine-rich repeat protein [Oscillospiraceae bacterium]